VSRRTLFLIVLGLGLLAGAYSLTRKLNSAEAAAAARPASPAPEPVAASSAPARPTPATDTSLPPAPAAGNAARAPEPQGVSLPDVDPHKAFGSKNAPVVIEIFSDFQCPACRQLYAATNRQLLDTYVNTGKVYLIHRDFPLQMHAYSKVAALYGRAASQIGKFEPVEQTLFENQDKWGQSGDVDGTVAAVLSPADLAKVRNLLKSPGTVQTLQALIDKDVALGKIDNVGQTPTTIFHSKGQTYPVAGAMTFEVLKNFVDQLLGQK